MEMSQSSTKKKTDLLANKRKAHFQARLINYTWIQWNYLCMSSHKSAWNCRFSCVAKICLFFNIQASNPISDRLVIESLHREVNRSPLLVLFVIHLLSDEQCSSERRWITNRTSKGDLLTCNIKLRLTLSKTSSCFISFVELYKSRLKETHCYVTKSLTDL
jgi:hypothetical protein